MNFSRRTIIKGAVIASVLALMLLVWLVFAKVSDNKIYNRLENAIASQSFANKLDRPSHSTIECYPDGRSSTCLALRYTVSADVCREIVRELSETDEDEDGCRFAQKNKLHESSLITYMVGKNSRGDYDLSVWSSR
jgi:hypothetical protein